MHYAATNTSCHQPPLPQLVRNILRHVPRPSLCGIKTDNPNRVLELAFQHVSDDGFKVGILDIGFAPAASAAIVNEIDIMIDAGDNRRGLTHYSSPTSLERKIKPTSLGLVPALWNL